MVSPEMVGSLQGGTISGETRRKGVNIFFCLGNVKPEGKEGGDNIPSRDVQPVSPELHIYIGLLSAKKTPSLRGRRFFV